MAAAVVSEEHEEFSLECLGILGNLTIPDLDYELLLREYDLVTWIKEKIQPGVKDRATSYAVLLLQSEFSLTNVLCTLGI